MGAKKAAISVVGGTPPTIRLSGDITPKDLPEMASAFHTFALPGCGCLNLDAGRVGAIEDLCARFLLQELRALERRGVQVKWLRASRQVREVLQDGGKMAPCRRQLEAAGGCRPHRQITLDLPCIASSVALVRGQVADALRSSSFGTVEAEDIILAVGEAAANAVRHGLRFGQECVMHLCCCVDDEGVCVEITDPGDGFDPERLRPPSQAPYHEGGLGIYLMRRVMDEVSYTFDVRGTTVRLFKRSHAPARARRVTQALALAA